MKMQKQPGAEDVYIFSESKGKQIYLYQFAMKYICRFSNRVFFEPVGSSTARVFH
jgi:hypothetical protein